jgi:outer membrane protein
MMRVARNLGGIGLGTALMVLFLGPAAVLAQPGAKMTLQESIDLAMKQSVLIHSAQEGIRGADAQQKEAFTGFLPKFSTSYSYTRLNEAPSITVPAIPPFLPRSMAIQSGTQDNYNWAFEVRQPVFAGGAIEAGYQFSRLGADIARIDESLTVQNTALEVKTAYLNVLKAEKLLNVANHTLEQLRAHKNVAQNFFDVGMIPRNDLLQSEVQFANGVQYVLRAENGLALAQAKFNTTLRREIDKPVNLEDILQYHPFTKSFEECLQTAFDRRGEVKQYHLKLDQAKQMVRAAKSEYFPSVNLVGNYARFGDQANVSGSAFKDQENWQVTAVANWNFWEWGKTKNRVEANRSRESQVADALTNVKDQLMLEVKNAWLLVREAEKQVFVARETIEQAEENFRINEERYKEQVATSTDVLDALTLLTRAKSDHTQALSDYHIYQARLDRAMGLN